MRLEVRESRALKSPIGQKFREIAGPKLNGTVKIPGKVFEHLGIRWVHPLWWNFWNYRNFVFHTEEMLGLVYLSRVSSRGHLEKLSSVSMSCVAEQSDAWHLTSEISKNLNRWFLLNGKRTRVFKKSRFLVLTKRSGTSGKGNMQSPANIKKE